MVIFGWGIPMKRIALTLAAAVLATGGSAFAADMPLKAPPPPARVMTWTGCYLDGGVGYGMYNQDSISETFPGGAPIGVQVTNGGRGWLGRLGAGCDYQIASSWTIGV